MRFILLSLTLLVGACSPQIQTTRWTEQVAQAQQEPAVVSRSISRNGWWFPGAQQFGVRPQTFEYAPKRVLWRSEPGTQAEPVAFDILGGFPVLVVFYGKGAFCEANPGATFAIKTYYWDDEGNRVELNEQDAPLNMMTKNLLESYWDVNAPSDGEYLTLQDKKKEDVQAEVSLLTWLSVPGRYCE